MVLDLTSLSGEIYEAAKAKGFWDKPKSAGLSLMLAISELGEAIEAHREDRIADLEEFERRASVYAKDTADEDSFVFRFKEEIKDTFQDEIADTVIRILDFNKGEKFLLKNYRKFDLMVHASGEILSEDKVGDALLFITKCICDFELKTAIELMFELSNRMGFDLMRHIELKLKYNKTRARLHGKKY